VIAPEKLSTDTRKVTQKSERGQLLLLIDERVHISPS